MDPQMKNFFDLHKDTNRRFSGNSKGTNRLNLDLLNNSDDNSQDTVLKEDSNRSTDNALMSDSVTDNLSVGVGDTKSDRTYVRFEVRNGKPFLIDGELYDKDSLLRSLEDHKKEISFSSAFEKNEFIIKVCKAFGLPTTIVNDVMELDDILVIAKQTADPLDSSRVKLQKQKVYNKLDSTSFLKKQPGIKESSDLELDEEDSELDEVMY